MFPLFYFCDSSGGSEHKKATVIRANAKRRGTPKTIQHLTSQEQAELVCSPHHPPHRHLVPGLVWFSCSFPPSISSYSWNWWGIFSSSTSLSFWITSSNKAENDWSVDSGFATAGFGPGEMQVGSFGFFCLYTGLEYNSFFELHKSYQLKIVTFISYDFKFVW